MNFKKSLIIALFSFSLVNGAFAKVTDDTVRKYLEAMQYFENDDYEKAFPLLKESAEEGLAEAQVKLGLEYDLGKVIKQDFKQAFNWYQKAANQEKAQAQTLLGIMYAHGRGIKMDLKKARYWFEKGAQQNEAYAQYMLATLYLGGAGGEKNQEKAIKYFKLSCDNGYKNACAILNSAQ